MQSPSGCNQRISSYPTATHVDEGAGDDLSGYPTSPHHQQQALFTSETHETPDRPRGMSSSEISRCRSPAAPSLAESNGNVQEKISSARAKSASRKKKVLERLKRRTFSAGLFRKKGSRSISDGIPADPKQLETLLREAAEELNKPLKPQSQKQRQKRDYKQQPHSSQTSTKSSPHRPSAQRAHARMKQNWSSPLKMSHKKSLKSSKSSPSRSRPCGREHRSIRFQPGRLGITFIGVEITEVDPSSQAAALGVSPGWTILRVGGHKVRSEAQICDELDALAARGISYMMEMEPNSASSTYETVPARRRTLSESTNRGSEQSPVLTTRKLPSKRREKRSSRIHIQKAKPHAKLDFSKEGFLEMSEGFEAKLHAHTPSPSGGSGESFVDRLAHANETHLVRCKYCNRNFSKGERIKRHTEICSKLKHARKVIDKHALGKKVTDRLGRRVLLSKKT
eukprot:CAMPEP_0167826882 /NCGR_PEP_ID=MMETSP0112_2-20121227/10336_1 /TAXON_ID=91324 /ORGANISM="Lotharella globosa, Strain CCCM811" /LENGTH=452 /DNA_ID=CAMNT_0007729485 /DNA_START=341 /DNA_END=1699 /DNA_ORIENTATION=+